MPQSPSADAFRHRAKRLGYQQIVIEKITQSDTELWYYVTAKEPLAGRIISFVCSDTRLEKLLKGVAEDEKYL